MAGMLQGPLTYSRSGGFVGTDDRVTIQPDGTTEAHGKLLGAHAGTLSAPQLQPLATGLRNWDTLAVTGEAPRGAADLFTHEITYAGKTLRWTGATPGVPKELSDLARLIQDLVGTLGR
jgi:hypothetical protein